MGRELNRQSFAKSFCLRAFLLICVMLSFSFYASAQVTVTGTIVDEIDSPMFGVVVKLKGEAVGTTTDLDGKYKLAIPDNSTLEFSFMGYKTQSVAVGTQKVINIKMHENTQLLDEVVVVGYSTIRKRSLTGALQVVESEKLTDATTPNVENLLTGKAPGVYVSTGSGQPGEAGKIVIRGKSTLSGSTDPLWVVDGVIMGRSGNDINPADIESLVILKDAASTAIYGSQGANGVVQVTTKSGKSGKLRINLAAKFVATTLNKGPFEVMNGEELYDLYSKFGNQDKLANNPNWKPELRNQNHDWWDGATQTGFAQDYNISISGGGEQLTSFVSLGLYDESGAVKGFQFTRYNLLAKLEYKPYKFLTIRPMVSGAYRKIDDREHSVSDMYTNMPWDSPYTKDGELVDQGKNYGWFGAARSNYLYDQQWNYTKRKRHEIAANMDFDVKITDWLTFASVNSYKFSRFSNNEMQDPRSLVGRDVEGRLNEISFGYDRLYTNQLLRINKSFDKHYISAVLGYEWNQFKSNFNNSIATGFPAGFSVQEAASRAESAISGRQESAVQSYLSNVNYSYDDRYLGQVSFRRDGASNFGPENKYGNFFSVSAGWNIHNESFFTVKEITNLKVRGSYGSVGNRPDQNYPHQYLYGTGLKASYNGVPGALMYSRMGNKDLKWEKTFTTGIGIDVSVLDRIHVSLDYYHKNTSDLLYEVGLPAVTGMSKSWRNAGKLKNQGFEASLGVDIFKTADFDWRFDANIGLNRNEITELYGNQEREIVDSGANIAGGAQKLYKPGMDSDTWWLKEWAGVDPKDGTAMWYKTAEDGSRVITKTYADADEVACGAYTPSFFGGFSTNLRYKDFDFGATFTYSVGGKIYNYARMEYDSDGSYTDRNQMKLHSGWSRWEKEGDIATHPKGIYQNTTNSAKTSSRFLETGTYLKLKNLTIGYNVPYKIKGISNIRAYVSGENLFTISHFSGVDPEIPPRYTWLNGEATGKITGVATSAYPSTRKFAFGVNITL